MEPFRRVARSGIGNAFGTACFELGVAVFGLMRLALRHNDPLVGLQH
jgi:hypothetical protein